MPPRIAHSAAASRRRKTTTPSQVEIHAATTISTAPPSVTRTAWKAEPSSRSGFFMRALHVSYGTT
jgi:hypothetical protein